jgi:hypothetical protein
LRPFSVTFEAETLTPPEHAVVIRTATEGWTEVVTGAYHDGAWHFVLDPARYEGELEFKFMLDERWQTDPNLKVVVTEGGQERYSMEQVAFQEQPAQQEASSTVAEHATGVAGVTAPGTHRLTGGHARGQGRGSIVTRLSSLRGKTILVRIPTIVEEGAHWYTLADVEEGGLWLIGEDLPELLDLPAAMRAGSEVPVFVPFAQISYVVGFPGPIPSEEEMTELLTRAEKAAKQPRRATRARRPRARREGEGS